MDTFTIVLNVLVGIFLILSFIGVLYSCKTESADFMHDYFGLSNEFDLPDELIIEIEKESPDQPSISQTETPVISGSASENLSLPGTETNTLIAGQQDYGKTDAECMSSK